MNCGGEVERAAKCAGVNFFAPGSNTSLFGKVDVAFGDETEGISARGGMRYNW